MMQDDEAGPVSESTDPARWVDEHGDALYAYAMMRTRDKNAAEDLVQETFLAALNSRKRFAGKSTLRTWLIGILRRKIIDHQRRLGREVVVSEEQMAVRFDPSQYRRQRLRGWTGDPAEIFENREFWRVFQRCTRKLPEKLADAYYLREIGQLATEEICKILDVTPTNLALRIYRARAYLRQCLDKNWFTTDK